MTQLKNILTVAVVLIALSMMVGAAGAAPGTTTNTTATNASTTPDSQTTTQVTTAGASSTTTNSLEQRIEDEVANAVGTTTTTTDSDCIEVTVKGTETCVPRFYHRVDNVTEVVAVDWDGRTTTIVLNSSMPAQRVSVVDTHSIKSSGSGDVTYQSVLLRRGLNVVRINAEAESGDKTLTIGTSKDLDYISDPEKPFLADGLRTRHLYISAFGGSLGSLFVATAYAYLRWRKLSKKWTDVFKRYKP
ncbi:hypothetical protein ACFQH6_15130 [Halobacteriaceae archaeon GCM10025711]